MTELIITEKPAQAEKIAHALAEKKLKKYLVNKVPYYEIEYKSKKILVGCAVGHLFGLKEIKKKGSSWKYPVFDVEWAPAYEVKKSSAFSKEYLDVLKTLAKKAEVFTVATDYDIEGETIGWNVVRFVCNQTDARRMKFSTLTKDELVESYEHVSPHLDFPQVEAGVTRHYLDYYWGISLSRALTASIKATGSFKVMSIGRVQGPSLKIIVDREKDIQKFKPQPFWEVGLRVKDFVALHAEGKIFDEARSQEILKNTKGKEGRVASVEAKEFSQDPPHPFDLTSLQTEAYRHFGYTPKDTLSLAQDLYTKGCISYPRTSSQKLPASLNLKKILSELSNQKEYAVLSKEILKGEVRPHEGKKTDPAHPAIFPTGEVARLSEKQKNVYDLIVRRLLATCAPPAKRETHTVSIDVNGEAFVLRGTRTIEQGWHRFYGKYAKFKDEEIPPLKQGEVIKDHVIERVEKATQPPSRYSMASLVKELEKRKLGTKATRSTIIDTLYQRNYVVERAIEATQLGIVTVDTLEKYCPEILDEDLTRYFEEQMEKIYSREVTGEKVLDEAKKSLKQILDHFRKNEKPVGAELLTAVRETQRVLNTVGACRLCGKGTLMIKRGRFGFFVACDRYPECTATHSVPNNGLVKVLGEECPECKYPLLLIIRSGKRPWKYCINKECPPKVEWRKQQEEKKRLEAAVTPEVVAEVPKKKRAVKRVVRKKVESS